METKQSIIRRAGVALGFVEPLTEVRAELPVMGSPNLPINPVNLTGYNNTAVSTDRALGLVGVYRAVNIISTGVSQLTLGVWRNGEELPLKSTDLVARPDLDMSLGAFLEQTTVSMALCGEAFWLLKRQSKNGPVGSISVLDPRSVIKERLNGRLVYRYGDKTYEAWQIQHLMLMRAPGYDRGIGPIQAAQNELRGALDLRNYSDNWFRDGSVPNGILKTDQPITGEQADAMKERFKYGQATRDVAVLGSGVSYQPVYLAPKDAQFLESRLFSLNEIARMFGVPAAYMLTGVDGNSMTYQNMQQTDVAFLKYTLAKYIKEIEAALSDLLPRGQEARFKTDELLRTDTKTRFEAHKLAIESGFMTVDEVRAVEGRLPLTPAQKAELKPAPAPAAPVANEEGESA